MFWCCSILDVLYRISLSAVLLFREVVVVQRKCLTTVVLFIYLFFPSLYCKVFSTTSSLLFYVSHMERLLIHLCTLRENKVF